MMKKEDDLMTNKYAEVGLLLSAKRNDAGLSIEDISKAIKISSVYVSMIEEGRYEEASKAIYYHGCVGAIARHLNLSEDKIFDYLFGNDSTGQLNEAQSTGSKATSDMPAHAIEIQKSHAQAVRGALIALFGAILLIFIMVKFFETEDRSFSGSATFVP